jgi:hypothetical protein
LDGGCAIWKCFKRGAAWGGYTGITFANGEKREGGGEIAIEGSAHAWIEEGVTHVPHSRDALTRA